mmetsp:Transcript_26775/g.57841  ORF Transcript_26775/g.57841 Transcript_26775/m.57841 type:complete len:168 (-) Transcript_26775:124-627(-)
MAENTENKSSAPREGDKFPDVALFEGTPKGKVQTGELFKGKKVVIFGVPGAFTPGCHKTHLPGYVQDFDKYVKKGVDIIACVAVNDPFVMAAWGKATGADGKIRMLADTTGKLRDALDIAIPTEEPLGNKRLGRFSAYVVDGVIKFWNLEPGSDIVCSLSNNLLNKL